MKTFVLIAPTGLIGGGRTERSASFDDYQSCACRRTSRKDALAARSRFQPKGSPRWSAFHLL